ncbi:hypothetical protein ILYODFUR_024957 [Ilyodon furcidens]|uniref:Uncharacterized protein n=1 Tax=Ilyodon furcidens TaxID=33524 RepID=A0ABV0TXG3_9TELE
MPFLHYDLASHRNFRKHLRMVGSRRIKAQTFAERRSKSFSRSWSDPTPVKTDSPHEAKDICDALSFWLLIFGRGRWPLTLSLVLLEVSSC